MHRIAFARGDESDYIGLSETVSIQLTCTNRDLPLALGAGDICVPTESTPSYVTYNNIGQPTPPYLPSLFQAVTIDGEPYWDSGYSGNPTITPLVQECESRDTTLVEINPVERLGTPRSTGEILNRLNEVSFNATLLKELRMIALLRRVANPADSEGDQWASMRIHRITSDKIATLSYYSKLNVEWAFLCMLSNQGRRAAEDFLAQHVTTLGKRSSLDLGELLKEV